MINIVVPPQVSMPKTGDSHRNSSPQAMESEQSAVNAQAAKPVTGLRSCLAERVRPRAQGRTKQVASR